VHAAASTDWLVGRGVSGGGGGMHGGVLAG